MSDSIIETVGKHLGRPVETACNLIENILGTPTKKLGELLGDVVSYWQWSNRLLIAEKAAEKLAARGINPRVLSMDFYLPFLRESGDAGDSFLQDWWAEMLASAVDDDSLAHVAFVHMLHAMSGADVHFLTAVLETQHVGFEGRIEAVVKATRLSETQARMSFHNLERLGFFTPTGNRFKGFAIAFLIACYSDKRAVHALREKQASLERKILVD